MLTEKQYMLLGRFSFAFNEVEFLLEAYFELLLGNPEVTVASGLSRDGQFASKVKRFKILVQGIGVDRPAAKRKTDEAEQLAVEAETLAKERNRYIHAVALLRKSRAGETMIRMRKADATFNDAKVDRLIGDAESLAERLSATCVDLFHVLEEQRRLS